jgi:NADPH:quinone reductase-like Zn-dependent oxidoreductase
MKAIGMQSHGGREQLKMMHLPTSSRMPNEVLVCVRATGVNRIDWMFRDGYGGEGDCGGDDRCAFQSPHLELGSFLAFDVPPGQPRDHIREVIRRFWAAGRNFINGILREAI